MANNQDSVVINNFKAIGYNADVVVSKSGFTITGKISTNGDKVINKFDGTVMKNDQRVCAFNSYQRMPPSEDQSGLAYNVSDITDITLASQALIAIGAAEVDIQAEVKKVEE